VATRIRLQRHQDYHAEAGANCQIEAKHQTGRVTNIQHFNGAGSSLANYTYAYDLASRLTTQTDNGAAPETYTYDATNDLLGDGTSTYSYW